MSSKHGLQVLRGTEWNGPPNANGQRMLILGVQRSAGKARRKHASGVEIDDPEISRSVNVEVFSVDIAVVA